MINKHAHNINKTSRKMDRNPRVKNSELYKLQMKYMELCEEILNTLSGKRGILRNLVGGRFNFSNRSVIRQDPTLRINL
jgi:DNA-directed RNA polymerase beta' subunit